MHELLVFLGVCVTSVWFGSQWGTGGAVSSGILGLIVAYALSSTMDGLLSFLGAMVRRAAILVATCTMAYWFGRLIDHFVEGNAHDPATIVGGVIGLLLCLGVQSA